MKFLSRLFRRQAIAIMARQALSAQSGVSRRAIMQAQDLLAAALGRGWRRASREAAAGMVLVLLARSAELGDFANEYGWELVLTAVGDHSRTVMEISPRAMPDLRAWQAARLEALLAKAA